MYSPATAPTSKLEEELETGTRYQIEDDGFDDTEGITNWQKEDMSIYNPEPEDEETLKKKERAEDKNRAFHRFIEPTRDAGISEFDDQRSLLKTSHPGTEGSEKAARIFDPKGTTDKKATSKSDLAGAVQITEPISKRITEPISKPITKSSLSVVGKESVVQYQRWNVVFICVKHGHDEQTAELIFNYCREAAISMPRTCPEVVSTHASAYKSKYRLRGNCTTVDHDSVEFGLEVIQLEIDDQKQLAVVFQRLKPSGRIAFQVFLDAMSKQLFRENYATHMGDGSNIIDPEVSRDSIFLDESAKEVSDDWDTTMSDGDDIPPPPSMLGLGRYVTGRRTPRRPRSGIRLDKNENSQELVKFWRTMLSSRTCPDTLKTIAKCAEAENNAKVIGERRELLEEIVKILGSKSRTGERDLQLVHCALTIVNKVIMYAAEYLLQVKIFEILVDNLAYFAGTRSKKPYVRSGSIQDSAIDSLRELTTRSGLKEFAVPDGTKQKLQAVLQQKRNIFNTKSAEALEEVCSSLKIKCDG